MCTHGIFNEFNIEKEKIAQREGRLQGAPAPRPPLNLPLENTLNIEKRIHRRKYMVQNLTGFTEILTKLEEVV